MTTPKELYKVLSADFRTEKKFSFANRGEGMMQAREAKTDRLFLINKNTKQAWELGTAYERFTKWDASEVEISAAFQLPIAARHHAFGCKTPYYFGVDEFRDGVAVVMWTLQPDGRYYADGDGFGMTNDEEINFYAFIDTQANILIPFQPMDEELMSRYRKQAIEMSRNPEENFYVCLSPELTIPIEEVLNWKAHQDVMIKIIYGLMVRFASQALLVGESEEYNETLCVYATLTPTPNRFISMILLANASKEEPGKYDVSLRPAVISRSEDPVGWAIPLDVLTPEEIVQAMTNEDNISVLLSALLEFAQTVLPAPNEE